MSGNGITRTRWFTDVCTGDHLQRPAFEELQQAIFHGEVRTVVTFKLDRLSRTLRDGVELLCDWLDKGIRLISVTQGHDFSGSTGRLIASVLFSVAEMEQSTRRERQAEGVAIAKAAGKYKGRLRGTFKSNPERARGLLRQGLTTAEVAAALNVSRRSVQRYAAVVEMAQGHPKS